MKFKNKTGSFLALALLFSCLLQNQSFAQEKTVSVPWMPEQAIAPDSLAQAIQTGKAKDILIINAGPVNNIKGAIRIGPVSEKENRQKLTQYLQNIPKDKPIVIYCGCCPMDHCPNIRPAFQILKKNGFTNFRILDIEDNLSTDWIRKDYPMDER